MKVHIEFPITEFPSYENFGGVRVNNLDFGSMLAKNHKRLIREWSAHNYHQIPDWVVTGTHGNCRLALERTRDGKIDEISGVLDFQSMYSTNNLGYGEIYKSVVERIIRWMEKGLVAIPRAMDHRYHAPALAAIKVFTGLDRVIMKSGGAETVETAVNIAMRYWIQNHGIPASDIPFVVSASRCFHGRTRLARSLSTSPSSRGGFGPLLRNILHVPFGNLDALRETVNAHRGKIAAIILEPIQGEGGVIIPPGGYLSGVETLCRKNGILFILDEIQTGFGRTGHDWAFEYDNVKPDLLCSGKAAGCGIAPVSFVAGRDEVMLAVKEGTEGATWSATPIQCLLVLLAIKALCDNDLSNESRVKGSLLRRLLEDLQCKYPTCITDVRGRGLFVGVDTVFKGGKVSELLLEEGVWAKETGEDGKTLRLSPPLVISPEEINTAVQAFERVVKKLANA